ncbi:MAG: VWA domain-containing protein, partial [Candidatus Aenigmarchaeota archaeon]|nr:VWA domain-containing protein [Candidatus Aenigmarchaeota archaeon]
MVDILNKKGFVKIGVGAGFIIAITVLLFFSSSLLTQIAAPTDLSGNMVDSIGGNQGTSTNKPVLIDVTRLGDEGNDGENDETGESEEDESDDDNNDEPVFISGGFFGGGGDPPTVQCPPPTHKVCDYENEQCIVVQGPGEDECTTDEDCYCDPKTPGYWENHLSEAEGLLDCVHDNYDVFDDVENQSDITYVLECSGNCSNMFNKLKKFLLATILNICADYFDLDDAYDGETIEYWIDQSVAEVENGESEMDEYYKDALDAILDGDLECNPESHTVCNYIDMRCDSVVGSGDDECVTYEDCIEECIPPYLEVDKTAEPTEVICEEVTITLEVSGEGEICDGFYPVDVVLVFDNSGSMDDDGWDDNISDWQPIGDAKISAKAFADLLGTNDKAGLVSFNTVATLEQGLTFDKNAVKSAIDGMSAGGWTNMSQGIDYGTQELVSNGRTDTPWIEILLSDGNNNCGMKNPPADCHQRVFDSAQEAADNGIVIYTIALGNNSNQSLMQDIANITGGKFYYAPDSEDLQEIYEEIAEEVTTMAGTNIVVIDYLPSYVELNESTLPPECVYDDIERKITCELDDLHINETVTITFNIYLHQFGYILTNVYPDSGVEYLNYNGTTVFEEFPETYVTSLDCDHTVCNYINMTCDTVLEPGDDECVTFDDCAQHTVCDYIGQVCAIMEGAGDDECSDYSDCFHTECAEGYCIDVQGVGDDQCETDSECRHHECNYVDFICEEIFDIGTNECQTFQDCPQHKVCDFVNELCIIAEGAGDDECQTFDDCYYCGDGVLDPGEECEIA